MESPSTDDLVDQVGQLVAAAKAGDRAALNTLIDGHRPGLHAFLRLRMHPKLRNKESVSDLVQSACLDACEKIGGFDYRGAHSFRNWLFRNAANLVVDKERFYAADRRAQGREVPGQLEQADRSGLLELFATFSTPSQHIVDDEDVRRVEGALDAMPDIYREVIMLARFEGMTHREIAARIDKSEESSRTILRRALVRLAALLDRPDLR